MYRNTTHLHQQNQHPTPTGYSTSRPFPAIHFPKFGEISLEPHFVGVMPKLACPVIANLPAQYTVMHWAKAKFYRFVAFRLASFCKHLSSRSVSENRSARNKTSPVAREPIVDVKGS
jgi:hypothetical protein